MVVVDLGVDLYRGFGLQRKLRIRWLFASEMIDRHRDDVRGGRGAPYGKQRLVEGVATVLDFSGRRVDDERIGFCVDVVRLGGVMRPNAVS